jgi:hypothetical protein
MTSEIVFEEEDKKNILKEHLGIGPNKSVSYLPISTIEKVLGLTTTEYEALVTNAGRVALTLSPEECCVKSGAVYAFSTSDLEAILLENVDILLRHSWPVSPSDFIRRMGATWLGSEDPILPIVQKVFGGETS